tara:strand:- start:8398 stop:9174 length:777 start_codon:yes stop_codon:yes gene_type:complete
MTDAMDLYLKEVYRGDPLTNEEVQALARRRDDGDITARNELVERNQGLVQKLARTYINACIHLKMIDLIQFGNMGLMRAADRYDPDLINPVSGKPFRFSTYAVWWIRQTMDRSVMNTDRLVRLPVHIHKEIRKMLRGEAPADARLERLRQKVAVRIKSADPIDFDTNEIDVADPVDEEERNNYARLVAEVKDALEQMAVENRYSTISRDVEIYRRRMGLDNGETMTLAECGKDMGITRERVRQVCQAVNRQLRIRLHV